MQQAHYQILNKLYESPDIVIYRACNEQTNQTFILKCLKQNASLQKKNVFNHEYKIVSSLNLKGVIQTFGKDTLNKRHAIVFEDFDGISLQSYIEHTSVDLIDSIAMSIEISEILGRIHDHFILHNNLNPSNIIINTKTKELCIIDFGQAKSFAQEMYGMISSNFHKSELSYISPEQTDRLNRHIDCRSDYYSLGATIYELFTRKKLFDDEDSLNIINKIRTEQPHPMNAFPSEISNVLSEIVLKLLSKIPEDRYQSIQGIIYDLNKCYQQLKNGGKISPFPIGEHDFSKTLRVSQKIYGRDNEIKQLTNSFKKTCQGSVEVIFVKGPAGVGKTSLIREVYKSITESKGYFIYGKFDQLQRDIPYSAFVQAFKQLIQSISSESQTSVRQWSDNIRAALKSNGQLLIDLIPELELLVGPQPKIEKIGSIEIQNRLYLVFQNLIKTICHSEHPLALFIDDLQWIDTASLKLLEYIVSAPDIEYLLLIGSYRNTDIDSVHPLTNTLNTLNKKEISLTHISLSNLDEDHLTHFIEDSLHSKNDNIKKLAAFIHDKTNGNPIFVIELIKSLYYEKLLFFDSYDTQWKWDIHATQNHFLADNVVNILKNRMKQLNPKTIHALKMASCLGNQFNLLWLSIICDRSPKEMLEILYEAISEKFLISLNVVHDIELFETNLIDSINMEYRFSHDKIQEAAKNLISSDESHLIHWHVGCLLRDKLSSNDQKQSDINKHSIFVIVNNLNEGVASIMANDRQERVELAKMNLKASRKARASAAYLECQKYLKSARNHLLMNKEDYWKSQYSMMYEIYFESAEAAYLSGNYDGMESFVEELEKHLENNKDKHLLQKSKINEIKILAYIAQNKLTDAINVSRSALEDLNFFLPDKANKWKIIYEFIKIKSLLCIQRYESLINRPELTDQMIIAKINIISSVTSAFFISQPEMFSIIVFKMFSVLLKNKTSSILSLAYVIYGLLLCGMGKIDEGYKNGQLALNLVKNNNHKNNEVKVTFIFYDFICHWKNHINVTIDYFLLTFQMGIEIGDIEFAARSLLIHSCFSFFIGKNLNQLMVEINEHTVNIERLNQYTDLNMMEIYEKIVIFLISQRCFSKNDYFHEKKFNFNNPAESATIFNFYLNKLILCFMFEDYRTGIECAKTANAYDQSVFGSILIPLANFYDSLTRLGLFPSLTKKEKRQYMKIINTNQRKMKKWKKHAPMNYEHKYFLVEAERFRVLKKNNKAIYFYDKAIEKARHNDYINEQAIANELAAKFFKETKQYNISRIYMMDALRCYQDWGATAKVLDIQKQYDDLLKKQFSVDLFSTSIIPVLQTLSNETDLTKLSNELIKILIEKTAAQHAYIITVKENKPFTEAQFTPNSYDRCDDLPTPIDRCTCLSQGIIRYVQLKRMPIILENAFVKGNFVNDAYIQRRQIKSILCLPVIHNNILYAIIYLENNDIVGAFTKNHLELLSPIFSQAAICFGNAMLYQQLESHRQILKKKIDERTGPLMDKSLKNSMEKVISGLSYELQFYIDRIRSNIIKIQEVVYRNDPDLSENDPGIQKIIDKISEKTEIANSEITNIIHSFFENEKKE